jgi:hypothetical protein
MSFTTWTTAEQKINEHERSGPEAQYNKFGKRLATAEEKAAKRARTLLRLLNKSTVPEPTVDRVEGALKLVWFTREGGVVRHAQVYFNKSGGYEFYYDVRDPGNPNNNVSNFGTAGDKYRDQSDDKAAEKLAVISEIMNNRVFPAPK